VKLPCTLDLNLFLRLRSFAARASREIIGEFWAIARNQPIKRRKSHRRPSPTTDEWPRQPSPVSRPQGPTRCDLWRAQYLPPCARDHEASLRRGAFRSSAFFFTFFGYVASVDLRNSIRSSSAVSQTQGAAPLKRVSREFARPPSLEKTLLSRALSPLGVAGSAKCL
jgi:hypothetical protein